MRTERSHFRVSRGSEITSHILFCRKLLDDVLLKRESKARKKKMKDSRTRRPNPGERGRGPQRAPSTRMMELVKG